MPGFYPNGAEPNGASGTTAAAVVTPPAPTVTGVAVSPATITLSGGASQQLAVVVTGTNSPTQAGSWTATAGQVTSGGLFTAPGAISAVQTITVTFTSAQDPSWSGHAIVTVAALVVVVPPPTVTPALVDTPGAPTDVMVAAVAGGLLVKATAPRKTGNSALVGYTIMASSGESVDVDSLPATITLPPLVSAYVTVTARNADGPGVASSPSPTATPTPTTPVAYPAPVPAPRCRIIYM